MGVEAGLDTAAAVAEANSADTLGIGTIVGAGVCAGICAGTSIQAEPGERARLPATASRGVWRWEATPVAETPVAETPSAKRAAEEAPPEK